MFQPNRIYTANAIAELVGCTTRQWLRWSRVGLLPGPDSDDAEPLWRGSTLETWWNEDSGGRLFVPEQIEFEREADADIQFTTEIKR